MFLGLSSGTSFSRLCYWDSPMVSASCICYSDSTPQVAFLGQQSGKWLSGISSLNSTLASGSQGCVIGTALWQVTLEDTSLGQHSGKWLLRICFVTALCPVTLGGRTSGKCLSRSYSQGSKYTQRKKYNQWPFHRCFYCSNNIFNFFLFYHKLQGIW
jgi:hypothetical protein